MTGPVLLLYKNVEIFIKFENRKPLELFMGGYVKILMTVYTPLVRMSRILFVKSFIVM